MKKALKKAKRQFEFSEEDLSQLDYLVEKHGWASRAECVRRALRMLYRISEMQDKGKHIGYLVDGKFEGIHFIL